jgi:hypothetical protein
MEAIPALRQYNRHVFETIRHSVRETVHSRRQYKMAAADNVHNNREVSDPAHAHPSACTAELWSILYEEQLRFFLYSLYKGLQPGDNDLRLQFCRLLLWGTVDKPKFVCQVLLTDEVTVNSRGINSTSLHEWTGSGEWS